MNNITFGGDPEVMLRDNKSGRIVSSLRILGRDKHDPIQLGDGIRMYADNALVEAAFPASPSVESVVEMYRKVLRAMYRHLGNGFSVACKASHRFDKEELKDPRLWESGCNPNFDPYAKRANPPADFKDETRTGSFHVHVGDPRIKLMKVAEKGSVARYFDVFLGCSSVIFDKDPTAPERRTLYGKAGEFRPTDYGIEYRVLGNWVLGLPQTTELVYDIITFMLENLEHREDIMKKVNSLDVQTAINTNNPALARSIIDKAGMPWKLIRRVEETYPEVGLEKAWGI